MNAWNAVVILSVVLTATAAPAPVQEHWRKAPFSGSDIGAVKGVFGNGHIVWMFTDSTIASYDLSAKKAKRFQGNRSVKQIMSMNSENILIMYAYSKLNDVFEIYPSLTTPSLNTYGNEYDAAILTDSGSIVAAGYNSGHIRALYFYSKASKSYREFKDPDPVVGNITKMAEDISGKIWLMTDSSKALYCFDGTSIREFPFGEPIKVANLLWDRAGSVFAITEETILKAGNDGVTVVKTLDSVIEGQWSVVDNGDNLWYFSKSGDRTYLNKMSLYNSDAVVSNTVPAAGPLFSYNDGVGFYQDHKLQYLKNGEAAWAAVSLDESWWNSCGMNLAGGVWDLLFRKDDSILMNAGNSGNPYPPTLIAYAHGICSAIPAPPFEELRGWNEKPDGGIQAETNRGTYTFDGRSWKYIADDTVAGVAVYNDCLHDNKGRIWKNGWDHFLLFENGQWQWIDSVNSNFPFYQSHEWSNKFWQGSDGKIWTFFGNGMMAVTDDGFHWKTFQMDFPEIAQSEFVYSSQDKQGNYFTWALSKCKNPISPFPNCSETIKFLFNGKDWLIAKRLTLPEGCASCDVFYEDLRGDLWIRNLEIAGDTIFCRFSNAASQWIRYDSTNSPFIYMKIAGEDPYTGNLYFQGTMPPSNDFAIYFLDRGPLSAVNPSEPRAPAHKTSFSGVLIGKNVIVNYSIPQFSRVNLSVYSPQGRLVQTLFSGYQKQGTYRQTFVFNHAPGVYLVKLSAPGAVQAVKIIAK